MAFNGNQIARNGNGKKPATQLTAADSDGKKPVSQLTAGDRNGEKPFPNPQRSFQREKGRGVDRHYGNNTHRQNNRLGNFQQSNGYNNSKKQEEEEKERQRIESELRERERIESEIREGWQIIPRRGCSPSPSIGDGNNDQRRSDMGNRFQNQQPRNNNYNNRSSNQMYGNAKPATTTLPKRVDAVAPKPSRRPDFYRQRQQDHLNTMSPEVHQKFLEKMKTLEALKAKQAARAGPLVERKADDSILNSETEKGKNKVAMDKKSRKPNASSSNK